MKSIIALATILLPAMAYAQPIADGETNLPAPEVLAPAIVDLDSKTPTGSGFLTGNRNFQRFIGFMSNPTQSIEPRAVTQVWPIFSDVRISSSPQLPEGSAQVYGAGLNLALSERLSVGLNQGGFAATQFRRNRDFTFRDVTLNLSPEDRREALKFLQEKFPSDPRAAVQFLRELKAKSLALKERIEALEARLDQLPDQSSRQGWLNIGGFAQYMVYQNPEAHSFLTAGLRVEVPCGSQDLFQGRGPAYLAPYLTAGKELGNWHVLATTGFEFAAERTDTGSQFLYANFHLDRQTFGWLYPLVEANVTHYTTRYNVGLPTERGYLDLGTFQSTGNIVTMAAGANAVLIRNKLEIGAVYTFPVFSERSLSFDGLLVKAVYRY